MLISCRRRVAVAALAWKVEASARVVGVRLNAIAASTSQAEFAAKLPLGRCAGAGVLQVGDDLFDDGAASVIGLGVQHRQGRVGEHGMVAPDPEQFALGVDRDVVGVGVADPAHDQPRRGPVTLRAALALNMVAARFSVPPGTGPPSRNHTVRGAVRHQAEGALFLLRIVQPEHGVKPVKEAAELNDILGLSRLVIEIRK